MSSVFKFDLMDTDLMAYYRDDFGRQQDGAATE
jgi:hypothetical protein